MQRHIDWHSDTGRARSFLIVCNGIFIIFIQWQLPLSEFWGTRPCSMSSALPLPVSQCPIERLGPTTIYWLILTALRQAAIFANKHPARPCCQRRTCSLIVQLGVNRQIDSLTGEGWAELAPKHIQMQSMWPGDTDANFRYSGLRALRQWWWWCTSLSKNANKPEQRNKQHRTAQHSRAEQSTTKKTKDKLKRRRCTHSWTELCSVSISAPVYLYFSKMQKNEIPLWLMPWQLKGGGGGCTLLGKQTDIAHRTQQRARNTWNQLKQFPMHRKGFTFARPP